MTSALAPKPPVASIAASHEISYVVSEDFATTPVILLSSDFSSTADSFCFRILVYKDVIEGQVNSFLSMISGKD